MRHMTPGPLSSSFYTVIRKIFHCLENKTISAEYKHAALWCSKCTWQKSINLKYHMSHSTIKPAKWSVCQGKTRISLGIHPVRSVFTVCMKKPWVLSYPLSTQRRLIRLGRCEGWSESSLAAQVILLVCCKLAHIYFSGLKMIFQFTN